jgi:hypothetical protein
MEETAHNIKGDVVVKMNILTNIVKALEILPGFELEIKGDLPDTEKQQRVVNGCPFAYSQSNPFPSNPNMKNWYFWLRKWEFLIMPIVKGKAPTVD